jgi:uncharacterized protein
MLDKKLMDILACPSCHGDVTYHEDRNEIECNSCGLKYPVKDGIPVMLIEEAHK